MQRRCEVLPTVGREHRLVGARRRVEGDLLLHRLAVSRQLVLGVAHDHEARGGVREVGARPTGGAEALVDGGLHVLAQILRAVERVHVQAVADLPRDPAHVLVHAGDEDGDLRMRDRSGVEERRHQIEAIELALEGQLGPVLPAVPDVPEGQDDLAHLRSGRLELHREAALVVPLYLRAQAQHEAAIGGVLQIPCDVGEDHRASRKRHRDRRAEPDPRRDARGDSQRKKRIVLGLRRPEAVVPHRLDLARVARDRLEVVGQHADVELHGRLLERIEPEHTRPAADGLAA